MGLCVGYKDAGQASANKEVEEGEDVEEWGSNEETPVGEKVHFCPVSSLVGSINGGVHQVKALIGILHETALPDCIIATYSENHQFNTVHLQIW